MEGILIGLMERGKIKIGVSLNPFYIMEGILIRLQAEQGDGIFE